MFFHFSHWLEHFSEDECELIADIANSVIARNGINVCGNVLENGEPVNFSKTKKPHDTHNAMLLDVGVMGMLDPNTKVQRKTITEDTQTRAYMSRAQRLLKNDRNGNFYNERSKTKNRRR